MRSNKILQHNSNAVERAQLAAIERTREMCQARLVFIGGILILAFLMLIARLYLLSSTTLEDLKVAQRPKLDFTLKRANIVDRNGELLATNIVTASLYANPKHIINSQEAAKQLSSALMGLDYNTLVNKLHPDNKSFVWVKRHLSPKEQQAVHNLGLPGLYFTKDEKRVYPQANLFVHTVGYVDVDGKGLAGIERYFDEDLQQNTKQSLQLSLDSRIQIILKDELQKSMELHNALGSSGFVMDVNTGEIIAMVSLPDFNPHNIEQATDRQKFNQLSLGTYEFGSGYKIITEAMALDMGKVQVNDAFNVNGPLQVARFKINDYKGKGGNLSVPEILMYSSNIGTAKISALCGINKQKEYLKRLGMLDRVNVELKEVAPPRFPSDKNWNEVSMITISYGHGIANNTLHVAQAIGAIVNGGYKIAPTLIKDGRKFDEKERVIQESTSNTMRKLLRLVVTNGYGKKANIEGYFLGGKSGTAEKVINGRYSKHANIASFLAAYPINKPQYLIFVIIDEGKPNKHNFGYTTGGMIAAPVAGEIVKRISPLLNVHPEMEATEQISQELQLDFVPRYQKVAIQH